MGLSNEETAGLCASAALSEMKEKAERRDPDHGRLAQGRLMSEPGCLALSNFITLS